VENGKFAEHWDVMETIADKESWQNTNAVRSAAAGL
jgi:predicted SnoaL-like aldol condensation-catalyzing enzyme